MKKFVAFLFCTVFSLTLIPFTSFAAAENDTAKNALTVGNEITDDNLPDMDAERWYKFENKTDGDVCLYLANTDGLKSIWNVNLYDSTAEKNLKYKSCVGTEGTLYFEALDAGTYYLQITVGRSYTEEIPTSLNYTVRVKTVADVSIAPNEAGVHVFTKAGEDMFILDGHVYSKKSDGTTVVGRGYDYNGDPYILLVGLTEEDIQYEKSASYVGTLDMDYSFRYEDDVIYYYLTIKTSLELETDLYVCNNGEKTQYADDNAYELLNLYYGKGAEEGKDSLWRELQKDYGPLVVIGIALAAIIVIAIVVAVVRALTGNFSSRSGSSYVSDDYTPGTPTAKDMADLADMDIAKSISNMTGGGDGI